MMSSQYEISLGSAEHPAMPGTDRWWATGVLCLALLLSGCAVGERRPLPGIGHGSPEAQLPPSPGHELLCLQTRSGTRIAAEFCRVQDANGQPLPDPDQCPTLIFFYARPMCLAQESTQKLAQYFRRMGVNVLIPDYPGYGMSGGRPTEKGCYAAADAAYAWIMQRNGRRPERIVIAGWSLGTGVAVDLASRRRAAGLIIVGAFTSIRDMSATLIPWPLRWLAGPLTARCRFDNLAKIPRVTCPILIVQGREDTFVPYQMGDRLAAGSRTKVTRLLVPRAQHADIWEVGGQKLWQELADWIRSVATLSPSASAPRSCVAPLRAAACCFPAPPHTTGSCPCFRRTQTRPAS